MNKDQIDINNSHVVLNCFIDMIKDIYRYTQHRLE